MISEIPVRPRWYQVLLIGLVGACAIALGATISPAVSPWRGVHAAFVQSGLPLSMTFNALALAVPLRFQRTRVGLIVVAVVVLVAWIYLRNSGSA